MTWTCTDCGTRNIPNGRWHTCSDGRAWPDESVPLNEPGGMTLAPAGRSWWGWAFVKRWPWLWRAWQWGSTAALVAIALFAVWLIASLVYGGI